jgi:hypothetical protein
MSEYKIEVTNEIRRDIMEDEYIELMKGVEVSERKYMLMKKVMGSSLIRERGVFKTDKPEIELYEIIDFIYELKRNRVGFNSCVYLHQCMYDMYYVGYAESGYGKNGIESTTENMMLTRLEDHRNNGGTKNPTNMTHLFPVVSCIGYFPGDKEDEDLMTILISKFAGNKVRGGKWASPFVKPKYPDITIEDIKKRLKDRNRRDVIVID